jgi:hypothetical protein
MKGRLGLISLVKYDVVFSLKCVSKFCLTLQLMTLALYSDHARRRVLCEPQLLTSPNRTPYVTIVAGEQRHRSVNTNPKELYQTSKHGDPFH